VNILDIKTDTITVLYGYSLFLSQRLENIQGISVQTPDEDI